MVRKITLLAAVLTFCLLFSTNAYAEITSITWTGEWSTNWGKMTLEQSSTSVTGDYQKNSGRISGLVNDNVLNGFWEEKPSYKPPKDGGTLIIKMSDDGKSFEGTYTVLNEDGEESGSFPLNGSRSQAVTTTMPIAEGDSKIPTPDESKTNVNSATMRIIVIQLDNPVMLVNGQKKEIDPGGGAKPVIVDERMLIPMRAVIESLGGSVSWQGDAQKITITTSETSIEMWLNKNTIFVNGAKKTIETPPTSINNRTMVPIRFVIDNIPNCTVDWDAKTGSATIKY